MTIRHETTSRRLMGLFLGIDNDWHTTAEETPGPMPVDQFVFLRRSLFDLHHTNRDHATIRHIQRPRNHLLWFIFRSIGPEVCRAEPFPYKRQDARPRIVAHLSLIHISEPTRLLSISY